MFYNVKHHTATVCIKISTVGKYTRHHIRQISVAKAIDTTNNNKQQRQNERRKSDNSVQVVT